MAEKVIVPNFKSKTKSHTERPETSYFEATCTDDFAPFSPRSLENIVYDSSSSIDTDLIDNIETEKNERYRIKIANEQFEIFSYTLISALESEPIEDGYHHPAENIITEYLKKFPASAQEWLQNLYLKEINNPLIASGILRCVGRQKLSSVLPWGPIMAISGLKNADVEIREAAVLALEEWGGKTAKDILSPHKESVTWLAKYITKVLEGI